MSFTIEGAEYVSVAEVASRLRVSRNRVYRWIAGRQRPPGGVRIEAIRDSYSRRAYLADATVAALERALKNPAVDVIERHLGELETAISEHCDARKVGQLHDQLVTVIRDQLLRAGREGRRRPPEARDGEVSAVGSREDAAGAGDRAWGPPTGPGGRRGFFRSYPYGARESVSMAREAPDLPPGLSASGVVGRGRPAGPSRLDSS